MIVTNKMPLSVIIKDRHTVIHVRYKKQALALAKALYSIHFLVLAPIHVVLLANLWNTYTRATCYHLQGNSILTKQQATDRGYFVIPFDSVVLDQ